MTARYYKMDPAFAGSYYPEHGTTGYDGRGWYCSHGGQLFGPFETKQEAEIKSREVKSAGVDEWENEGGS
jgi:hypothetical protein